MLFSKLSGWYETIVHLFYGKEFYQLQAQLLNHYENKHVLVVGGGGGGFLPFLNVSFESLHLVDSSTEFCQIAQKRLRKYSISNTQVFQKDVSFLSDLKYTYDVVFFPFFLDLFSKEELKEIVLHTTKLVVDKGEIVIIDFDKPDNFLENSHYYFLLYLFRRMEKTSARSHFIKLLPKTFAFQKNILKKEGFYTISCWKYKANPTKRV